jgi:hypothetical protein
MILALVLASAAVTSTSVTSIDAERAFIRDAQTQGQWTAFRKWAADDALMFTPQPVNAQTFLKNLKDPPVAIGWWPGASYVSCDGSFAVNTGPWVNNGGRSLGYFTTVWRRTADSWRWIYDGGDATKTLRAEGGDIKPTTASCEGKPGQATALAAAATNGNTSGGGLSLDRTLTWSWTVGAKGERHFVARIWTGEAYQDVIDDRIAASE